MTDTPDRAVERRAQRPVGTAEEDRDGRIPVRRREIEEAIAGRHPPARSRPATLDRIDDRRREPAGPVAQERAHLVAPGARRHRVEASIPVEVAERDIRGREARRETPLVA